MKTKLPTPQQLPSGMYRCQVMVNGKRESVVDEDPDVCQAKAVALKSGLIENANANSSENITLSAALDQYIEIRKNVLSPSTIRGYRQIQKHYMKELMQKRVLNITETDLQKAINSEAQKNAYKTIKNAFGLCISVIGNYKEINTKKLRFPQRIKKEHTYLDANQIVDLITACRGDPIEIPILLAVWLGMRRSEIIGLQWGSVDFEKKTIRVENVIVRAEDQFVLKKETKNTDSRRTLSCPDYILSKLECYEPDRSKRSGQVFKINPDRIYQSLKKICDRNSIPFVGIHGLRHTNASVMLSLGITDKVAMKRGGWSTDRTMKDVYQHVFQGDRQSADSAIDGYFNRIISDKLHTDLPIK